jgi:hypothetical protein
MVFNFNLIVKPNLFDLFINIIYFEFTIINLIINSIIFTVLINLIDLIIINFKCFSIILFVNYFLLNFIITTIFDLTIHLLLIFRNF